MTSLRFLCFSWALHVASRSHRRKSRSRHKSRAKRSERSERSEKRRDRRKALRKWRCFLAFWLRKNEESLSNQFQKLMLFVLDLMQVDGGMTQT